MGPNGRIKSVEEINRETRELEYETKERENNVRHLAKMESSTQHVSAVETAPVPTARRCE